MFGKQLTDKEYRNSLDNPMRRLYSILNKIDSSNISGASDAEIVDQATEALEKMLHILNKGNIVQVSDFLQGQKVRYIHPSMKNKISIVVDGPDREGQYTLMSCDTGDLCYGYADTSRQHCMQIVLA